MYKALLAVVLFVMVTTEGWAAASLAEIQKAAFLPKLTVHFKFDFEAASKFDFNKAKGTEIPQKKKAAEEMEAKLGEQGENIQFLLKLANTWDEVDEEEKSKAIYRKLQETLSKSGKNDTETKQLLMEAAKNLGDFDETEKVATELLMRDARNASARLTLADVQFTQARQLVTPGQRRSTLEELLNGIIQVPEAQLEKLDRLLKAAASNYEQGLELATNEFGRYHGRACVLAMADVLKGRINGRQGEFNATLFLVKSIKDEEIRKIAAAHQDDVSVLVWLITMATMKTSGESPSADELPGRLQWLEKDPHLIPRLEHFLEKGDHGNHEMVGKALMLYAIQAKAYQKGSAYTKRLTELMPEDIHHWRSYLNFLEYSGKYEQLIQEAKGAKRYERDAWTHLKMAKAYEMLRKPDNVSEEIELATRLAPDDQLVKLFACFWVIKNSDPKGDDFSNYGGILAQLDQMSDGDDNWVASIAYTRGLYYALRGITVLAEQQFERAEKARPGSEDVARLRELLK